VGECARQTLERFAGRHFGQPAGLGGLPGARAETRREAEKWWDSVKNDNEADHLEKVVQAQETPFDINARVRRLAEIAPGRAVSYLKDLLRDGETWYASTYLSILESINDDAARALMRELVTQASSLKVRVMAAQHVTQEGISLDGKVMRTYPQDDQHMARRAMLKEWVTLSERDTSYEMFNITHIVGLGASKDLSLLPTIVAAVHRYSPKIRAALINSLAFGLGLPSADPTAATNAVLEKFLADQLEDVTYSGSIIHKGKSANTHGRTARLADIAADALRKVWPERYSFTWDVTNASIEKARFECLRAWRSSQGLTPDPPPHPHPAPVESHDPWVVTRVVLGNCSEPLPIVLQWQVDAWVQKPLDGDALVQFLADFAEENRDDALSLGLTATRAEAQRGITIELQIRTEANASRNPNHRMNVTAGGRKLLSVSDTMDREAARRPDTSACFQLKHSIEKALATPAEPFRIHVVRLGQRQPQL
jgi:hypothetical protein